MDNIERVLVPVDFSDCSNGVVEQAAFLAARLGASLSIVHAVDAPHGIGRDTTIHPDGGAAVSVIDHLRSSALDELPRYRSVVAEHGVEVDLEVVEGTPVDAILGAAERLGAGMIVMGTHGRRGLQRVFLGSVAEAVLRRADVPVVTVRSRWHEGCDAKSCSTCTSHLRRAREDVETEFDG